jgi:hypothetical protein
MAEAGSRKIPPFKKQLFLVYLKERNYILFLFFKKNKVAHMFSDK